MWQENKKKKKRGAAAPRQDKDELNAWWVLKPLGKLIHKVSCSEDDPNEISSALVHKPSSCSSTIYIFLLKMLYQGNEMDQRSSRDTQTLYTRDRSGEGNRLITEPIPNLEPEEIINTSQEEEEEEEVGGGINEQDRDRRESLVFIKSNGSVCCYCSSWLPGPLHGWLDGILCASKCCQKINTHS